MTEEQLSDSLGYTARKNLYFTHKAQHYDRVRRSAVSMHLGEVVEGLRVGAPRRLS